MELPTKMSATKLLAKVKELQKQYPNAVYSKAKDYCSYTSGRVKNGPKTHGCIIGQAIRELYPENFSAIKKHEKKFDSSLGIGDILPDSKTRSILGIIQYNQDYATPWGEC